MSFAGLRVALVGPTPPPAGGMANQTRLLAERLHFEQATVVLVSTNAPYRPGWVAGLPVIRAVFRLAPYLVSLWRAAGSCSLMHVMANSGWSWHLFSAPAIWVARSRRTPVIVNYHGGEAASFLERSHRIVQFSMRQAAALIVPSGYLNEVFARFGMPANIVPNVVDLSEVQVQPAESGREIGDHPHVVVPRNLELIYDNATAVHAFVSVKARFPGASMTIAGSGPEEANLRSLVSQLGLTDSVRFTGRLERDGMARLYQKADVVLNPSQVDNMPVSLLEAMASGVPIVSTNVGGIPWMVEDGVSALLVKPGDAAAMAAAISRLIDEPALRSKLAGNGLKEAERYTWPRVRPLLAALYASAQVTAAH